ncbi:hypothetical protein ACOJIV_20635 [Haloarcula sp. AONF1]
MNQEQSVSLDELTQRERYREIREAHDRVTEWDSQLYQLYMNGRIDKQKVSQQLGHAVSMFVREVEPILNPPNGERDEYWTEKVVGEIPLPSGERHEVVGLGEYLELPDELTQTVTEEVQERYYSLPQKKKVEKTVHVPVKLHRQAYRMTNHALSSLDLGLDFSERTVAEEENGGELGHE